MYDPKSEFNIGVLDIYGFEIFQVGFLLILWIRWFVHFWTDFNTFSFCFCRKIVSNNFVLIMSMKSYNKFSLNWPSNLNKKSTFERRFLGNQFNISTTNLVSNWLNV
jgi:hypothetical protein